MAKAKYKEWLEPEGLLLIKGWKNNGLTDEQIADNIGVNHRTFERWKSEHSQIRQVIKRGKEHANYAVENALLKKAIGGNTTAMIFWLKNNYREKYSDSQKTPLEEQLTKEQIRRTKADANVAESKAKITKAQEEALIGGEDSIQDDGFIEAIKDSLKDIWKDDDNED